MSAGFALRVASVGPNVDFARTRTLLRTASAWPVPGVGPAAQVQPRSTAVAVALLLRSRRSPSFRPAPPSPAQLLRRCRWLVATVAAQGLSSNAGGELASLVLEIASRSLILGHFFKFGLRPHFQRADRWQRRSTALSFCAWKIEAFSEFANSFKRFALFRSRLSAERLDQKIELRSLFFSLFRAKPTDPFGLDFSLKRRNQPKS